MGAVYVVVTYTYCIRRSIRCCKFSWHHWLPLKGGRERRKTGYACPTLSQVLDLWFHVCIPFCVGTSATQNTCNTASRSPPDQLLSTDVSPPFWAHTASPTPSRSICAFFFAHRGSESDSDGQTGHRTPRLQGNCASAFAKSPRYWPTERWC